MKINAKNFEKLVYFEYYLRIKSIFDRKFTKTLFIMLLQFSVRNFKTFREKATMSLLASNYDQDVNESENVIHEKKFGLRVLKSMVIYGANASGKSKFVDAIRFMKRFVMASSRDGQKGDPIPVDPFRLNKESAKSSSEFEVIFLSNNVMYRYGFEVDQKKVVSEWLYYKPKTKEVELFYREGNTFDTHETKFSKGATVANQGLVRTNALLLSVAAQFNDGVAMEVLEWFEELGVISGLREEGYTGYTMGKVKNPETKRRILSLLQSADLDVEDIKIKPMDWDKFSNEIPKELVEELRKKAAEEGSEVFTDVLTYRFRFDANHQVVGAEEFSMQDDESSGTRKFFALTGPILDVLQGGKTLFVDELDSKIHPNLVCKLISLFNSSEFNPNNAQLVFNTHDTNLLSSGLFRRDQIWFVEKNKFGEARLYSLADFKSTEVKKSDDFEKDYIRGKYGAVPFLGMWGLLNERLQHENEG